MLGKIVEERHSLRFLKARTTCLQGMKKVGEATSHPTAACHKQGCPCRARRGRLQRLPELRQRETLCFAFGEKPEARHRSHQPMQRRRVQIQRPRELSGAPRTVSEMIRQSNLGSDLDDLGNRAPGSHLYQLNMRWKGLRSGLNCLRHNWLQN